ncbi:hypothetical protein PCANC_21330 [Puccinia coronata f. sp. avenae]|uniref:Uncharacterized protein n=1 Tax=Puccinia coronata f. sp. avenae TaxID=200324 RepID=A0A2N5SE47_9BASI|nr:hypothetical protein PCANC_21330 [Puccinia coronata f. sp. avenae]
MADEESYVDELIQKISRDNPNAPGNLNFKHLKSLLSLSDSDIPCGSPSDQDPINTNLPEIGEDKSIPFHDKPEEKLEIHSEDDNSRDESKHETEHDKPTETNLANNLNKPSKPKKTNEPNETDEPNKESTVLESNPTGREELEEEDPKFTESAMVGTLEQKENGDLFVPEKMESHSAANADKTKMMARLKVIHPSKPTSPQPTPSILPTTDLTSAPKTAKNQRRSARTKAKK